MDDPREFLTAAMRNGDRVRIRYAPPHDPESECVILPRGWTVGSSFFAWEFASRAYRTFDAAFIISFRIEEVNDSERSPFDRSNIQHRPPGRGVAPVLPLPPSPPSPLFDRSALHLLRRFGWPLIALMLVVGVVVVLTSPDRRAVVFERVFGSATPLPTPTLEPTATSTATPDMRVVRTATAAAAQTAQQATLQAPCHPDNGICFEFAGGVLVLALPQNALFLAYPTRAIDPAAARTVMRHHIRAVVARSEDDAWLQLRLIDGEELWVQSGAVAAQGALDAIPLAGTPTPTPARSRPRRTPTP